MKKYLSILLLGFLFLIPNQTKAWGGPFCVFNWCTADRKYFIANLGQNTFYPPTVIATTTVDNTYGICHVNRFSELNYFDVFGTRVNPDYGGADFGGTQQYVCIIPQLTTASTSQFELYEEDGTWCTDHPFATREQCIANSNMRFVKNIYKSDLGVVSYDSTLNDNSLAVAIMAPLIKMVMGSGLGVLKMLLPYILAIGAMATIIICARRMFNSIFRK